MKWKRVKDGHDPVTRGLRFDLPLLCSLPTPVRAPPPVNMALLLANVSFGILALMPKGWFFMACTVVLEAWLFSRLLFAVPWQRRAALTALTANVISGGAGFGLSILLNGGWWVVVWFPWVSHKEVNTTEQVLWLSVYYLLAFLLSVTIETLCAQWLLQGRAEKPQIRRTCLLANLASYAAGSTILYTWSFGLWS